MTSRTFLRLKMPGATVIEIDPSTIISMRVVDTEDEDGAMYYYLTVGTASTEYIVCTGDFDVCHHMLNDLHDILNVSIIDL